MSLVKVISHSIVHRCCISWVLSTDHEHTNWSIASFATTFSHFTLSSRRSLYLLWNNSMVSFPKLTWGRRTPYNGMLPKWCQSWSNLATIFDCLTCHQLAALWGSAFYWSIDSFKASTRISFHKFSRMHVSTSTMVTAKRPSSWLKNSVKQSPSMRLFLSAWSCVFKKIILNAIANVFNRWRVF